MNITKLEQILKHIDAIEKILNCSDGVEVHIINALNALRDNVTEELKELVWGRYQRGEG